jgi:hypothetical protein
MSEPEARKLASQGVNRERDKGDVRLLLVPCLPTRTCLSMASRRTRIASSSLLCSSHDSPLSRSGRHRHRSFRRTLDTQWKLTGGAVSPGP